MSVTPRMYDEVIVGRRLLIERFRDAWVAGDVDALMTLMTDDAVFRSSVGPDPGRTFRGATEIEQSFRQFLSPTPSESTTTNLDDLIGPDFAVTRWFARTVDPEGAVTEVCGCDVFEFEGALIRLKDTYRKVLAPIPEAAGQATPLVEIAAAAPEAERWWSYDGDGGGRGSTTGTT